MRSHSSSLPMAALALSVAASLFVAAERPARADAPLKVLRHLTFDAKFDSDSTIETKNSGIGGPGSGTAFQPGESVLRKSTISVDVVAATADGGLAVDISEEHLAPVRVGITGTMLFYDRHASVTDEERALLHYLARDFVKADTLETGTTWTEKIESGVSDRMTYKVTSIDADAKTMTLDIDGATTGSGPAAYTATTTGTMTYDTGKVVPTAVYLSTRSVATSTGRTVTTVAHITATLEGDSFTKK